MSENLTIGTLAKRGGVNVETIRYYQRRGLLQEPAKPRNGFRQYASDTVKRVRFIKRAQALGFTLEEITGLLTLDERRACSETRGIAAHKLELIEEKIADLSKIKKHSLASCAPAMRHPSVHRVPLFIFWLMTEASIGARITDFEVRRKNGHGRLG